MPAWCCASCRSVAAGGLAKDAGALTYEQKLAALTFVKHHPRVRSVIARSNPALAATLRRTTLAMDAAMAEGEVDTNDLPEWPEEPAPLDMLRNVLSKHLVNPDDVERALAIAAGEENDADDVRQEFSPADRLRAWLTDERGLCNNEIAEIDALLIGAGGTLSEVGEAVFEGASDSRGRWLTGNRKRGDQMSSYAELKRAELATGIDVLALDSANVTPEALYRRVLRDNGVDVSGIRELSALKAMHGILLRRQAGGSRPFAADSSTGRGPGNDDWLKAFGVNAGDGLLASQRLPPKKRA
jgi:hypothetical protein